MDYLYVQNYFFDGVEYLQIYEFNGKEFEEIAAYQGGIYFDTNELRETTLAANTFFGNNFEFPTIPVWVGDDGELEFGEYFDYALYDEWEKSLTELKNTIYDNNRSTLQSVLDYTNLWIKNIEKTETDDQYEGLQHIIRTARNQVFLKKEKELINKIPI